MGRMTTTSLAAARLEAARRPSGQFGTQPRTAPGQLDEDDRLPLAVTAWDATEGQCGQAVTQAAWELTCARARCAYPGATHMTLRCSPGQARPVAVTADGYDHVGYDEGTDSLVLPDAGDELEWLDPEDDWAVGAQDVTDGQYPARTGIRLLKVPLS